MSDGFDSAERTADIGQPVPLMPATMRQTIRTIADPGFREFAGPIADWIRRSIDCQGAPMELLALQTELARQVLSLQAQRANFTSGLANDDGPNHSDELERAIQQTRRFIRIIRDIADGMAWRALKYDRPLLRQLSMKPQTGGLVRASLEVELEHAVRAAYQTGGTVILNDLTNFLRYGDYTVVCDDGIEIGEVKAGRGSARSGHATRQRQRLRGKLDSLSRGVLEAPRGGTAKLVVKGMAVSHAARVRDLLRESRATGVAHARLSDSLAVEVFRPRIALNTKTAMMPHNPFSARSSYTYTTLKFFHRWAGNLVPISLFPFDVEDRAGILTGEVIIASYFSLHRIVQLLRRRNLVVNLPTDEALSKLDGLKPGQVAAHELDAPIIVSRPSGPLRLSMPYTVFSRIHTEYLDDGSFAAQVEQLLDSEEAEPLFYSQFANESELWD